MLRTMKITRILCLLILATSLLSQALWADAAVSADEAAARVQREYGGRILAVETRQQNGQTFYRIKVLTRKGVVQVVRINAGSR